MTTIRAAATLFAALAIGSTALASGGKGNAAAGKEKAVKVCAACHGADGNKTLDNTYPRLGGQYADYLEKVLHDYKSGKRKNPVMAAQAQTLSEKEIADLAAYYASQKPGVHDLSK